MFRHHIHPFGWERLPCCQVQNRKKGRKKLYGENKNERLLYVPHHITVAPDTNKMNKLVKKILKNHRKGNKQIV